MINILLVMEIFPWKMRIIVPFVFLRSDFFYVRDEGGHSDKITNRNVSYPLAFQVGNVPSRHGIFHTIFDYPAENNFYQLHHKIYDYYHLSVMRRIQYSSFINQNLSQHNKLCVFFCPNFGFDVVIIAICFIRHTNHSYNSSNSHRV